MAEPKRNPAVGKAWLAWWALQGDEDPAFIAEYLDEALGVLDAAMERADPRRKSPHEDQLSELFLVIMGLRDALDPKGSSVLKMELRHRRRGKPINRHERAVRGRSAAAAVERLTAEHGQQESALSQVSDDTGLSRSEIMAWLRSSRSTRDLSRTPK